VLFGVLAAVVSFLGSWIPSLWGDEAASALSAQRSLPSLFRMLGHVDAVHGTYYLGLHFWVKVFGASPLSLRAPSALAVGAATAAVVLICVRLGSRRLAVLAGIACVVLPRLTYAGEEARSFAFDAAIAAILTLLLVELLARNGRPRLLWVVYAGLLCVGCYLFLYVALIALAHAIVLVAVRAPKRLVAAWAIATGIAMVAAAPIVVWGAIEREQIAYLANQAQVTASSTLVGLWFGNGWFAIAAWTLIVAGIALAAVSWRRTRRMPVVELIALCWLAVPSLVLIGSSVVVHDFTARYLTFCAPAAALLIACGIDRLASLMRPRPSRRPGMARAPLAIAAIVTAAVVALAAPVYAAQRGPYAKNDSDWAAIAATVRTVAHPGDAIAFDDSVRPSRRPRLAMNTYPSAFVGLRDVMLKTPYTRNDTWHDADLTMTQAIAAGRLHGVQRIWVVEYAVPGHVDSWGLATLRTQGFTEVRRITGHRSVVVELQRIGKPAPAPASTQTTGTHA
jgi:Predicted membrane protein